MLCLDLVLWVVQIVNAADHYGLNRFGLRPRVLNGLQGIVTAPFLSTSYYHLLTSSVTFVLLGWVVLLSGWRPFAYATGIVLVTGGLATWLIGPNVHASAGIVGAGGLVIGWMGYLMARAFFSRRIRWILVAVLVLFFFGGILDGLLPGLNSGVGWQTNVCGFAAGVLAGWVLHPRKSKTLRQLRSRGPEGPALPAA